MAWTSGGPLLTLEDFLEDLKQDPGSANQPLQASPARLDVEPTAIAGEESLHAALERTYTEMNVALAHPGYAWLGLTQKLCAGLTLADELVTRSQLNLGMLLEKVKALRAVVERGNQALASLQKSLAVDSVSRIAYPTDESL